MHGEARIERAPQSKYLVEHVTPLTESIIWTWLLRYYQEVPHFISSNSRLCRDYAQMTFNYMRDFYEAHPEDRRTHYILELGAGHGRFTYLFARHLARLQPYVVVFTDVAEGNLQGVSKHPRLQEYIARGEIDFAMLDAGDFVEPLRLLKSNTQIPRGSPVVVIGNYVLDSLMTDAVQVIPRQMTEHKTTSEVKSARLSVYSDREEADPTAPAVLERASFVWDWIPIDAGQLGTSWDGLEKSNADAPTAPAWLTALPLLRDDVKSHKDFRDAIETVRGCRESAHPTNLTEPVPPCAPPAHLFEFPALVDVLKLYVADAVQNEVPLSITLPIGALSIISRLRKFSDNNLFCIFGDKGYSTVTNMLGQKCPHLAIHGTISFGCNFHAIQRYCALSGGFSFHAAAKSSFHITCFCFNDRPNEWKAMGSHIVSHWHEILPDMTTTLINEAAETERVKGSISLRHMNSVMRISCHDPDSLQSIPRSRMANCSPPEMSPLYEEDLLADIAEIYANWFKIRKDDDLPETLAHMCLKLGRPHEAMFYFSVSDALTLCTLAIFFPAQEFIRECPEMVTAGTLTNLAGCSRSAKDLVKSRQVIEECLRRWPNFEPAVTLEGHLRMSENPLKLVFLGCGNLANELAYFVTRDDRCELRGLFDAHPAQAEKLHTVHRMGKVTLLDHKGWLAHVCAMPETDVVLDMEQISWPQILPALWAAGKNVLCDRSCGLSPHALLQLLDSFNETNRRRLERGDNPLVWEVFSRESTDTFVSPDKIALIGTPLGGNAVTTLMDTATGQQKVEDALVREILKQIEVIHTFTDSRIEQISARYAKSSQAESTVALTAVCEFRTRNNHSFVMGLSVNVVTATPTALRLVLLGQEGSAHLQSVSCFWKASLRGPALAIDRQLTHYASPLQDCLNRFFTNVNSWKLGRQKTVGGDLGTLSISRMLGAAHLYEGLMGSINAAGRAITFTTGSD